MSAADYPNAREFIIKNETNQKFDEAVAALKSTVTSYGFSAGAVNDLQLALHQYDLTISEKDGRSGGYHYFADGKPFYEMVISAPGSLMELGSSIGQPLAALTDAQQSLLLFFEIGFNLVPKVAEVAQARYGIDKDQIHGGGGMPVFEAKFDTTFRCDPALFVTALKDLVDMRLNMLFPKPTQATKPSGLTGSPGL